MSDFRDALHRAARPYGDAVGEGLAADAVVTSSAHGIRRGRRRRATAQAGVGVLGVVAIGVGAWMVLPLGGAPDQEPAGVTDPVHAGPYRYDVGADPEAFPIEAPSIMLGGEDEVMCGDQLTLTPGVQVHDPDAFGRDIFLAAELVTLGDVMEGDPPATPEPLFSDWPDGPTNGWDPATATWEVTAGGAFSSYSGYTLLLDDDTVTGVTEGMGGGGQDDSFGKFGGGTGVASPGQCGEVDTREGLVELANQGPGDPLSSLLVAQFWGAAEPGERVALGDRVPLATIVVDPNEPANSDASPADAFAGPPEPENPEVAPAALREPDGFSHQAFVVPTPEPGCAPLADLRAAGYPATTDPEYNLTLPQVGDPDGQWWGPAPVLTVTGDDTPWFFDRDAWLVADSVSAGMKDPHLEWTPLSSERGWALAAGGADPLRDPECTYVLPVPEVQGAVFLVIDGVDSDTDTGEGRFQTWVYLGEAD